jgi:tetrahydromethanopterin S-methyltransferase subunit B
MDKRTINVIQVKQELIDTLLQEIKTLKERVKELENPNDSFMDSPLEPDDPDSTY